ncbi:MAG: hypothetical protein PHW31_02735 [Candidatus Pacebacteria bacterium]|nr:hypothetical protein [Candidatus Paceibacterota bacterium]
MKTILVAILAVFIIILGAFYWCEYRPSQIREKCAVGISLLPDSFGKTYENCLHEHGLEK